MEKIERINVIIAIFVLLTLSMQFLFLSMESNQLAAKLIGNNPYLKLIGTSNNIIMFLYPSCLFIFLIVTTKLMLDIFNITTIDSMHIFMSLGLSCIIPMLGMSFYVISFIFFRIEEPITNDSINKLQFTTGLSIDDYKTINNFCWIIMFYIMAMRFYLKYDISIIKSLAICTLPTALSVLLGYFVKNFV